MSIIAKNREAEILKGILARDHDAFDELYNASSALLYGLILKIVRKQEIAEDCLQECFIKIWNNIHQFDPNKGSLLIWMAQIARNIALDTFRNKVNNNIQNLESVVNIESNKFVEYNPSTIGVKDFVQSLKPDYREVIELLYYKGLTQDEAAKHLNMPLGTLKTRARNAILELKNIFKA
ncbi:MAG: sigma-70 family RNA polymerase sigma factor [Saprospiraceae bacterium]|nr:sigma-70 family RNA polymerase sigma factor [Saprospiraceae bacterium]